MKKHSWIIIVKIIGLLYIASSISCNNSQRNLQPSLIEQSLSNKLAIPQPMEEQLAQFNRKIKAAKITVTKENRIVLTGYPTENRVFLDKIITPLVLPKRDELAKQHPVEFINTLTLFSFAIYQQYFGKDFYRWAGDILDLDDPQNQGIRHRYKYGIDCSGFVSMPYELAVYFNLLKPEDPSAVFSSRGFELYCKKNNMLDKGGREGTSNRYRVDSSELAQLGREIILVQKKELQPQSK